MLEALQNNFLTGFSTPFRFILTLSTNSSLLLSVRVFCYLTQLQLTYGNQAKIFDSLRCFLFYLNPG